MYSTLFMKQLHIIPVLGQVCCTEMFGVLTINNNLQYLDSKETRVILQPLNPSEEVLTGQIWNEVGKQNCKNEKQHCAVMCPTGSKNDDRRGVYVCHLLAALPCLLLAAPVFP